MIQHLWAPRESQLDRVPVSAVVETVNGPVTSAAAPQLSSRSLLPWTRARGKPPPSSRTSASVRSAPPTTMGNCQVSGVTPRAPQGGAFKLAPPPPLRGVGRFGPPEDRRISAPSGLLSRGRKQLVCARIDVDDDPRDFWRFFP